MKNCDTVSPELFWWGRWDFESPSRHWAEVKSSWTVLELEEPQHKETCKCVTSLTALFGSTYLCESVFSHMKIIQSKYCSTILMIIWKCAWGWLSADTVPTMHPWLIPCQSKSSEEGNIVVLCNIGSCSYVRYTNIYCTYKELSIWHFINSSQAENVCAPLLQIHLAVLNKRSNVNAGHNNGSVFMTKMQKGFHCILVTLNNHS